MASSAGHASASCGLRMAYVSQLASGAPPPVSKDVSVGFAQQASFAKPKAFFALRKVIGLFLLFTDPRSCRGAIR